MPQQAFFSLLYLIKPAIMWYTASLLLYDTLSKEFLSINLHLYATLSEVNATCICMLLCQRWMPLSAWFSLLHCQRIMHQSACFFMLYLIKTCLYVILCKLAFIYCTIIYTETVRKEHVIQPVLCDTLSADNASISLILLSTQSEENASISFIFMLYLIDPAFMWYTVSLLCMLHYQ